MQFHKTQISIAVAALCAAAPFAAQAQSAPTSGTLEIWWKAPATSGQTVSGRLERDRCYVNGRGVQRVEFFLDNTRLNTDSAMSDGMTCVLDTTQFSNGTHTLLAVAYDSSGRTYREPRTINIQNTAANTPPTVSITAPTSGQTVSGSSVSCAANASDANGSIRQVQFFMDGTALTTDTSSPYGCTFDSTRYSNGTHTLRATATDNNGATTSTQITFTVSNQASTLPQISFSAPAANGPLSGNVQGPPNCTLVGTNISRVEFYLNNAWINTDGNASNGWGCWIDTTRYANGSYTLTARAFNAAGESTSINHPITITNNAAPTVTITAPQAGATLATSTPCTATAADTDGSISSVRFDLVSSTGSATALTTDTSSPYGCTIDTSRFANGSYTLRATATDNGGRTAVAERSISINKDSGGSTGSIDAADIVQRATEDLAFSEQRGYTLQAVGQYYSANSIPEAGVHYDALPNGETMRFGKVQDPQNSATRALMAQVHRNDPNTSSAKRAELRMDNNIQWDRTYWVAFSVFVYDWGTLTSGDQALYGVQLHSGDDSSGYSPSFAIYTAGTTGRRFNIQVRGTNQSTIRYAEQDIPFGRWVDFVFKFRQNTSGSGFLQAWQDGTQIVNHQGNIGYNVGVNDYFKFGYYNWTGASSNSNARKVLLRSPTVVADPTGSKYSASQLRALLSD